MLDRDMYTIVRTKIAEWWSTKTVDDMLLERALTAVYAQHQMPAPSLIR